MRRYFIVLSAVFSVFTLIVLGIVHLDLLFHPWLHQAAEEWRWYNYLSHHTLTVLYLHGWVQFLTTCFILSALASLKVFSDK